MKKIEKILGKDVVDSSYFHIIFIKEKIEYHFLILEKPVLVSLFPIKNKSFLVHTLIYYIADAGHWPVAIWEEQLSEQQMNNIISTYAGIIQPTIITGKKLPDNYRELISNIYRNSRRYYE